MTLLFTFLQPIYNDAPEPWQIGFQDGASPGFEGITELHDSIFFFLVVISVGVFWALGSVMINFNSTSSPIVYKYSNHGLEIIFAILIFILLLNGHEWQFNSTKEIVTITSVIFPITFKSKISTESQSVLAHSTVPSNTTTRQVKVNETNQMIKSKAALLDMLEYLSTLPNQVVLNFLKSNEKVQELLSSSTIPPVELNVDPNTGDIIAFNCRNLSSPGEATQLKGISGITGVYIIFNLIDGISYVGSAISPISRLKSHRAAASSVIRNSINSIPFYNNMNTKGTIWENMYWALLTTDTLFEYEFGLQNPNYVLNRNELKILVNFSRFFIRVKEQVLLDLIKPSGNVDSVRFIYNWKPTDLSVDPSKIYYEVLNAETNEVLFSSAGIAATAHYLGKTVNQFKDYLDHEKSVWVEALQCKVFIRTQGVPVTLKTGPAVQVWLTTEPVKFIDVSSLPDRRVYLFNMDRIQTEYVFDSPFQAAWELDGKSEYQYINRYLNIEYPVKTSKGTFFFVRNSEAPMVNRESAVTTIKPFSGSAGKSSAIILYDTVLNLYIEFKSKNKVGQFLWGMSKVGGAVFDRYLHNGIIYQNRLKFYFPDTAPKDISIISSEKYFDILGSNRFPEK